jgi:hypothetical protein
MYSYKVQLIVMPQLIYSYKVQIPSITSSILIRYSSWPKSSSVLTRSRWWRYVISSSIRTGYNSLSIL